MAKILDVLHEILKEVEKENPFNLVLKGGTALSIYYLNHHRESEDLDFDVEQNQIHNYKEIKKYLVDILERLKQKKTINEYKITKEGFASTNRYHIKLVLKTHKPFYTKIDVDFVELPKKLIKKGHLNFYTTERIFIAKAATFVDRKEFKDIYDLAYLLKKIDYNVFRKNKNVIVLLQKVISVAQTEDMKKLYKAAFRNVDLKFKDLKESQIDSFVGRFVRDFRILINKLGK